MLPYRLSLWTLIFLVSLILSSQVGDLLATDVDLPAVEKLVRPGQEHLLQSLISAEDQERIKELIVFGDSISDVGRLRSRTLGIYVPPSVYWRGRLTNGPNWVDYVCGAISCRVFSYAVAGAATRLSMIPLRWIVRPLDAQVDEFLGEQSQIPLEKAIAVMWIGANNYLKADRDRNPDQAYRDIRESAENVLKSSVPKLMIGTLPELAGILNSPESKNRATDEEYRKSTKEHNILMHKLVLELQTNFPNKKIALYDAYKINQAALDDPRAYGFTSLTEACYKGDYRGNFYGEKKFCKDPFGLKFWDYTHSNSRMHCYYAVEFLSTLNQLTWIGSFDAPKAIEICRAL